MEHDVLMLHVYNFLSLLLVSQGNSGPPGPSGLPGRPGSDVSKNSDSS